MIVQEPISSTGTPPRETFVINIGPQHPATHGVLRVKMTMDGEYIVRAEPVCGYIHRMQEKMGENRTYAQFLPNTSRIDYLSAMTYTHGFVGCVERALKLQIPPRVEYIRVITSELNRISSHLVWWGAFHGSHEGVGVVHGREVIDAARVGQVLEPGPVLAHLFMHAMDVAGDGFRVADVLALHLQLHAENAVGGRVLRSEIDREGLVGTNGVKVFGSDHGL